MVERRGDSDWLFVTELLTIALHPVPGTAAANK